MSPQEAMICKMADEIRAGRLLVTGAMSVRNDPAWFRATTLESPIADAHPPAFETFTLTAELDCRKTTP